MFTAILDILVATLQRINALRYIRNIIVAKQSSTGNKDIWVTDAQAEIGDFSELYIPVNAPEQPPPTLASDYRPVPDLPLVLRLRPRIVIPNPANGMYDPTRIALGCVHALTFTDGVLPAFMSQTHDLPPPPSGVGNTGFMWGRYKLETLKVLRVGPIDTPLGMEVQLVLEGMILLHPPTGPEPRLIDGSSLRPSRPRPPPSSRAGWTKSYDWSTIPGTEPRAACDHQSLRQRPARSSSGSTVVTYVSCLKGAKPRPT